MISLFGAGFIGGEYASMYPDVEIMERDRCLADSPDILYMISTIHNYHPKDGDPFIDVETNLSRFLWDLDINKTHWESDMVFNLVSTWFVYGRVGLPAKEDSPCNPNGFYSITSLCREQLLKSYCETFGLKYRILRLGNVIGIGDKKASLKKNALQHFIKELAQGRDITRYKQGSLRDYIDVRDACRGIHLVLEKGNLNETYNIANGEGRNVKDLIDLAHRYSGYKSKIREMEIPQFHKTVQVDRMWMDIKKIKSLGYVKQHCLEASIEELVRYYEANEG